MINGLGTIVYKVSDLTKAKDWYSKAFSAAPYFDQPFYVGFNIGGFELGLDPDSPEGTHPGTAITYWRVDNIENEYKKFISNGAREHEGPREVGHGIFVASVIDPFENIIGLIFNPHFEIKSAK